MALANAGLGVVHGFAAPIGGMFDAPHGAVCAALLASGMEANIVALRTRMPGSEALNRYREIACMLTGVIDAGPEEGVKWIRTLVKRLEIPRLRQYGIQDTHVGDISEKAARSSSMKANPLTLTTRELEEILEDSL
jgi:alcohol dehydrogenase class IV